MSQGWTLLQHPTGGSGQEHTTALHLSPESAQTSCSTILRLSVKIWLDFSWCHFWSTMFEEPSLTHIHPALILFHLIKSQSPLSQQVVQHPRDQCVAHVLPNSFCTFWSSSSSGWHHLPHTIAPAAPPLPLVAVSSPSPLYLLPLSNCQPKLLLPPSFSCHHPTFPFSQTFSPGKSPEAMHLQRFSILGTRRKLPSALLRARPSCSTHSWHQAGMVVLW